MLDNHHRKHHVELRVVEGKILIQIAQYELDVTWDCPDTVSIDDVDDRVGRRQRCESRHELRSTESELADLPTRCAGEFPVDAVVAMAR
jgi:hypothetical protein